MVADRLPEPATEGAVAVQRGTRIDDDDLLAVQSFDDAVRLAAETFGADTLTDVAQVIGTGFEVLQSRDKAQLTGVPCLFLSWQFNEGDLGEFVSAMVVTRDGRKVVVNDGSTGIYAQLKAYTARTSRFGGLRAMHGLRVSNYEYDAGDGRMTPAQTYYIDTSA